MSRTLLSLLFLASPSIACDWTVEQSIDPMTDEKRCRIHSDSAHLTISVWPDKVLFISGSAYSSAALLVRVDELPMIFLAPNERWADAKRTKADLLLAQILSGSRIRVQFRDYPLPVNGDAPICDLPKLIESCKLP